MAAGSGGRAAAYLSAAWHSGGGAQAAAISSSVACAYAVRVAACADTVYRQHNSARVSGSISV